MAARSRAKNGPNALCLTPPRGLTAPFVATPAGPDPLMPFVGAGLWLSSATDVGVALAKEPFLGVGAVVVTAGVLAWPLIVTCVGSDTDAAVLGFSRLWCTRLLCSQLSPSALEGGCDIGPTCAAPTTVQC